MHESRFVEDPFRESVDGIDCVFDDMDFINGVKLLALGKGYDLDMVEQFIASKEGWWGVYDEYCSPTDVIAAYEQR